MPTNRDAQAFLGALRDAGFVDGKTVVLDLRASGVAGAPAAGGGQPWPGAGPPSSSRSGDDAVRAARRATAEIPIVMLGVSDPVETGIVASLGRPGRNVTGVSVPTRQLATKQIGLLREIVPGLSRVAVLANPSNPAHGPVVQAIERAMKSLGVSIQTSRRPRCRGFRRGLHGHRPGATHRARRLAGQCVFSTLPR